MNANRIVGRWYRGGVRGAERALWPVLPHPHPRQCGGCRALSERTGAGRGLRWWRAAASSSSSTSSAPRRWDHGPVVAQIARDAADLLGGKPSSGLMIDECSFPKQGDCSVGVARQWSGRLGKVDNCQVAVFGVLTDGQRHAPVDVRLYLPKVWIDDPARCDAAGVAETARKVTAT